VNQPAPSPASRLSRLPLVVGLAAAFAVVIGAAASTYARDAGPEEAAAKHAPADWRRVVAAVDGVIAAKLEAAGVQPAPRSDDSEFLRRVYLDLLGTVPTPDEVESFLADTKGKKRTQKIDELLASDAYAENQASVWFHTLTGMSVHAGRPKEGQGGRYLAGEGGRKFHEWLSDQIATGRPYNEMVEDLLTANGRTDENGAAGYLARWESNPNNTAGAVAKHFLGVQIQCAQCHDHKYEPDWKQKDFQGMAAFFALTTVRRVPEYQELQRLRRAMQGKAGKNNAGKGKAGKGKRAGDLKRRKPGDGKAAGRMDGDGMDGDGMDAPDTNGGMEGAADKQSARARLRELQKYRNVVIVQDAAYNPRNADRMMRRIKKSKNEQLKARAQLMTTTPKFWMATPAADLPGVSRRYLLARWITSDDNPYFARTLVNRLWGTFMGRGIVDPVDDFNSFQEPSHPEILKILAKDFKAGGYDLRRIQRILLNTKTYQRTSRWTGDEIPDPALFAHARIRPLNTEQLYFSLVRATGLETRLNRASRRQGQTVQRAIFSAFTFVFDDDEGKAEEDFSGSIPQGLFLMNGELIQRALAGGGDVTRDGKQRDGRKRGGARKRRFGRKRGPQTMLSALLANESSDSARVDQIYLRAFGRHPEASERADAVAFVKSKDATAQAYEDLFWSILNSAEFMTNH